MATRQVDGLGKHITRLADGANNVVCFLRLVAAEILNLVQGLIEGRTDKVGHASVDNGKLLVGTLLDVEQTSDERTALCHYGTSKLEVQLLTLAQTEMSGVGLEVGLEVGHWLAVGIVVAYA